MRTYPNTADNASIITNLPKDTSFKVLGENGGWLKVNVNGQEGWVIDDYVSLENGLQIVNMNITLNVRSEPSTTSAILGTVKPNGFIIGVVDDKGEFIKMVPGIRCFTTENRLGTWRLYCKNDFNRMRKEECDDDSHSFVSHFYHRDESAI